VAERRAAGSAALVLVDGATPLRPEPALFRGDAGGLAPPAVQPPAERLARRWPGQVGWAHSTVRSYQGALAMFLAYVCDPRYGCIAECEQRVGARPVQVCHEDNTASHVADYEGRPERRPLTRAELQAFFDAADDRVEQAAASRRKGWLATPRRCQR
jgi:integrase/recombinase XerC